MAKFENELDIAAARAIFVRNKKKWETLITSNKALMKAIKDLEAKPQVQCYIFAKSVAFRIGKGSIKTIANYATGFKTSFPGTKVAKEMFSSSYIPNTVPNKADFVILAAIWYMINHKDKVKSESDSTEAAESEQVVQTQEALKKIVKEYGSVKLQVGNKTFDVDDFKQVGGRPKADMTFDYKGTPVIFVSHKKGSKPGDFQQYGGFASDLGISAKSEAARYPEISAFIDQIEEIMKAFGQKKDANGRYDFNPLRKGANFAKLITDESVARTVMFGKDYKTNVPGLNNCSILIDGDIVFKPVKGKSLNVFKLEGSYHTEVNPCLLTTKPTFKSDASDVYSPAMFIYKSEAQGLSQGGFSNVRAVIWPNNTVIQSYRKLFDAVYAAVKNKDKKAIEAFRKDLLKP